MRALVIGLAAAGVAALMVGVVVGAWPLLAAAVWLIGAAFMLDVDRHT